MVYERDDIEGLDSSIILNRFVWKYSGHEDTFSDPLVDCRECKTRLRADKLEMAENVYAGLEVDQDDSQDLLETITFAIRHKSYKCPNCRSTDLTDPRPFNLMFRTHVGAAAEEDESSLVYLRPETAQGIF